MASIGRDFLLFVSLTIVVISLFHLADCIEIEIYPGTQSQCMQPVRRFLPSESSESNLVVENVPPLRPQDILPRLKSSATLRDNIVTALGTVLLLCLTEEARVPIEMIYDAVRTRNVLIYDLLPLLPMLQNKIPRQQLYSVLQMFERTGSRFVSEYATLCMEALSDGSIHMEKANPVNILTRIDDTIVESIRNDKKRKVKPPVTLDEAFDFMMEAVNNGTMQLSLSMIGGLLLNLPNFDFTDPEVPDSLRFVAAKLDEMSDTSNETLLEYLAPHQLAKADKLVKAILERLEIAKLPSETLREAISILLQNFDVPSYPSEPPWKDNLRNLFQITTDYYSGKAVSLATFLYNELNDTDLADLDVGVFEESTEAFLQVLMKLRRKPKLSYLDKPFAMLIPFVSQKAWHETTSDVSVPITFSEVNDYLDSLSMPCLPKEVIDAGAQLRPLLSENLPWTYAFGRRGASSDPWIMMINALVNLRSTPLTEKQAILMDNFIYQVQYRNIDKPRSALYDVGIIFQRDDSPEVELDIYSLLMRIPNVFREERFSPMLNFFSRPNLFSLLGHEFNKFEYDKPRNLLLSLLKKVISIPAVQSDSSLVSALKAARDYLEEPLLVNMYTTEDLQTLIRLLPQIDEDPRYLPLKILFKKQKLFAHLSPSFSLAGLTSPMKHLELILNTVNLKPTHKELSESIRLALNNIDSQPLPPRLFNYGDFTYLVNQLLSHQKKIRDTIVNHDGYKEIESWRISVRGTPEAVLLRALTDLTFSNSSDTEEVQQAVQMAEKILEEEAVIDIPILKKKTLEAMLEYLPDNSYVKPVNLLLKKANLLMLVPSINVTLLDDADPRDALIMLIKALTQSRNVRAEKTLLRRLRSTLRDIETADYSKHHNLLVSYLMQILNNPAHTIFKPLIEELQNADIKTTLEGRDKALRAYLNRLRKSGKTSQLRKAAQKALEEMYQYTNFHPTQEIDSRKIEDALLLLSRDSTVDPLRKLLTLSWLRSILPSTFKTSTYRDQQQLLRVILFYTKQRPEVADNPSLMKGIEDVEKSLGGWATDVEPLKKIVTTVKSTIYDSVRNLLSATNLNKLQITVLTTNVSAKTKLLGVVHQLFNHRTVKKDENVMKVLAAVLEDINNFGVNKDLLSILDDMGVQYTPELAPLRLFLHREVISDRYNQVFQYQDRRERFNALLHLLYNDKEVKNQNKLAKALKIIKNSDGANVQLGAVVTDLSDIVNAIPSDIVAKYSDISDLFDINILSQLTDIENIIQKINPMSTLLLKVSELPIVAKNYTLLNRVLKMYKEVERVQKQQILTGFQIRPLIRELDHIQRVNVDFVNQIIDPEVLRYLDSPDFSDVIDDEVEILRYIINYVLSHGIVETDNELKTHLNSINRDLQLVMGPSKLSKHGLTGKELNMLLPLIPKEKAYTPIRIFMQSRDIFRYIRSIDFKKFSKPHEKLIKVLKTLDGSDLTNTNLKQSIKTLQQYLKGRFNFITRTQVDKVFRVLVALKLKYDVIPLKIFLNHDNLIKYLPRTFRYQKYKTPKDALLAILEILMRVPVLQKRTKLCNAMIIVKKVLQTAVIDQSYRKALTHETLTIKDLEFVKILNITSPKLKTFFEPQRLLEILPETFSFGNQPTFKLKATHLIRQLIMLKTEVQDDLKMMLRDVQSMSDVPKIKNDDLRFILDIIPESGIPNISLLKKFLTVSKLTKLLPASFVIKKEVRPKDMLREFLMVLNSVMGENKDQKLQVAIDSLLSELLKADSNLIPNTSALSVDDVQSLLGEIPFKDYDTLKPLETVLEPSHIISALPLNFNLTKYETKKLRVLALLEQVSDSKEFESWLESLRFVEKIIGEMPDAPRLNDTDIGKLLDMVPLDAFYLTHLKKSCTAVTLSPYLPINFDVNTLETRKQKLSEVMKYCEMSSPADYSTRQALDNLKKMLENAPGLEIRQDQVKSMIDEIPCVSFFATKPLKMYLLKNDITSSLPWDLDIQSQNLYKTRLFSLIKGLRNVRQFQNKQMFAALDALESDIKGMPDKPDYDEDIITKIKGTYPMDQPEAKSCADGFTWEDSLKFMPSSLNAVEADTKIFLLLFLTYSEKIPKLRDNKEFMESCDFVKKKLLEEAKEGTLKKLQDLSNIISYVPLKLHIYGWRDRFYDPIDYAEWTCRFPWKCFYGYERDMISLNTRVPLKVLLSTRLVAKSKALSDAIDATQSMILEPPTGYYEIEEAINEIPRSEKYDELRLLLGCNNMVDRYLQQFGNYTSDTTPKSMLLNMLYMIKSTDGDSQTLYLVNTLKEDVTRAVRDWEVEQMFKTLPDYNFHITKLEPIRSYYILHGPVEILGVDYTQKYMDIQSKLSAIYRNMMALPASKLVAELRESLEYLNKVMNNQIQVNHKLTRSINDINIKALFIALPKTRDENIIMGALRFFSKPNLLASLNLRQSPFEYETKGNLLQAILDRGLEIQSVRKDSLQQDALEFFRDKVLMTGPGAEPIELKNSAENSNRNVDLLDLLKAVDLNSKKYLDAAGKLTVFFETDYDSRVHGAGFDQAAHTSCGSYLKAFLQHLLNLAELPGDIKEQIEILVPAVKLNGTGAQPINFDDDNKPDNRMFGDVIFPDSGPENRMLYANDSIVEKISMVRPSGTSKISVSPNYSTLPTLFATSIGLDPDIAAKLQSAKADLERAFNNLLKLSPITGDVSIDFNVNGHHLSGKDLFKDIVQPGTRMFEGNDNIIKNKTRRNNVTQKESSIVPNTQSSSRRNLNNNSKKGNEQINEIHEHEDKSNKNSLKKSLVKSDTSRKKVDDQHVKGSQRHNKPDTSIDSATFQPGKILFDHQQQRLLEVDPETATFHPHKVLISPHSRRSGSNFAPAKSANDAKYVTMEEAESLTNKKRQPVQPVNTEWLKLPEPDTTEKFLLHGPERKHLELNLKSRKLFIRPETSVDIDYGDYPDDANTNVPVQRNFDAFDKALPNDYSNVLARRMSGLNPLEYYSGEDSTSRTVKKDLSKDFLFQGDSSTTSKDSSDAYSTYDDISELEFEKLMRRHEQVKPENAGIILRHKKHEDLPSIEVTAKNKREIAPKLTNTQLSSANKRREILTGHDLEFLSSKSHINSANRVGKPTESKSKRSSSKNKYTGQHSVGSSLRNLEEYENPFHADNFKLDDTITTTTRKQRSKSQQ